MCAKIIFRHYTVSTWLIIVYVKSLARVFDDYVTQTADDTRSYGVHGSRHFPRNSYLSKIANRRRSIRGCKSQSHFNRNRRMSISSVFSPHPTRQENDNAR